jgi:methionyl-tRNA synthetase
MTQTQATNGAENMTPQEIKTEIARLIASRKNQVNVEFEGYEPGHEMPQDRMIAELAAKLHENGHIIINDVIYSRDQVQAKRESFNGRVKQYMADNPGQNVPSETLKKWQEDVGMNVGQIKHAVKVLGM